MSRDGIYGLRDPRRRPLRGREIYARRIPERLVRDAIELRGHGRREHERLALPGHEPEDPLQVGSEAHVHHPVRFVEHQHLDEIEAEREAIVEIEEPPRSGDEKIHAVLLQQPFLRRYGHAAVDDPNAQIRESGVVARVGFHLGGQLPRGSQHQRAEPARPAEQPREDRKDESGGLSGSGLRRADQVLAFEDERNGSSLDRRGVHVAGGAHTLDDGGRQPE